MKTYEIKTNDYGDEYLLMTEANGKVWNVSMHPANSDYAEYLRYTEWVEAGNTPEEFWTQEGDI